MEQLYEFCRTVDMGASDAGRNEDKEEVLTQVRGCMCRALRCGRALSRCVFQPFSPSSPPNAVNVQVSTSLQRTNADLAQALTHALHCRLRWGGRAEDAASLAVLLLKVRMTLAHHQL